MSILRLKNCPKWPKRTGICLYNDLVVTCFLFTHNSYDDCENTCTLSYYHHQFGSMTYLPLSRVRSWNNDSRCMPFYSLINNEYHGLWLHCERYSTCYKVYIRWKMTSCKKKSYPMNELLIMSGVPCNSHNIVYSSYKTALLSKANKIYSPCRIVIGERLGVYLYIKICIWVLSFVSSVQKHMVLVCIVRVPHRWYEDSVVPVRDE